MSQWKDSKRGDYRYHFLHKGVRYAGGGYQTKREAAAGEARRREEVQRSPVATQTGTDFLTVSNQYLDDAERRLARSTYRSKTFVFSSFLQAVGNVNIDTITPQEINKYLLSLKTNCLYNCHRKELSSLWNFARRTMKLNVQNPLLDLDKLPHTPKVKVPPSQDAVIKIILAAAPGDEKDLIITILHTLGRVDEVLRIRWSDVNFEKRVVTLWTRKRKGGQYESDDLPMSQDLFDTLMRRWKARKQEEWVFWSDELKKRRGVNNKLMRKLCKKAGITPHIGFHHLRHFMASYHADTLKTSVSAISKMLRHRSMKVTEVYLHSIDESVRNAMGRQDGMFAEKEGEKADERN